MKKLFISGILLLVILSGRSQETKTRVLEDLEQNQISGQDPLNATIKSATRLFKDKDDLTSVILVIPKNELVEVIEEDTAYLHVEYLGERGYIETDRAEIMKVSVNAEPAAVPDQDFQEVAVNENRPVERQIVTRYTYLENKYGTSIATRIYEGKIWKGMNAEMVKDSWGSPRQINSIINGNTVREEWKFGSTMLYFQNSTLTNWGPAR